MNQDRPAPSSAAEENIWKKATGWLRRIAGQPLAEPVAEEASSDMACCSDTVHIAYRGKVDDHLYMAYNRKWQEVRFYQPNGLRVFCVQCRRRVL